MVIKRIDVTLKKLNRLKSMLEKDSSHTELLELFPGIQKDLNVIHRELLNQHLQKTLKGCFQENSRKKAMQQVNELVTAFQKLRL